MPKCKITSSDPNPAPTTNSPGGAAVIEAAIRKAAEKPTGELTKADYKKVTRLSLLGNQLTDVTGLEKLTQLETLYLTDNQLTDVKGLEKLTQLTKLSIGGNQLTNVTGLEKLTQLRELHLAGNRLTDVKGLEKLAKLKELKLGANPNLTKAQIGELQKALPGCKIISDRYKR